VLKTWTRSLSSGTRTPERNGLMLIKRSCGVIKRVGEANVNVHAARMRNSKYADMLRKHESLFFGHFGLWYLQL
jgi:hypothetical protein